MAPEGSGEGNTKTPPLRIYASKCWCLTAYNLTTEELIELIGSSGSYILGNEICKTTGRKHIQGYIEFKSKCRPMEKIKSQNIHWEKSKGSRQENLLYCSKENDFITNFDFKVKKPLKLLNDSQLYDWQKEIIDLIKTEPDERSIHWYWERKGCSGKTTFCKYLSAKYGAIPLEGKKNDILYCAAEFESDIYIWDIERSIEDYVSYSALEKIKNGYFMCSKYESKPIIRNNPHVIVFANFRPKVEEMSLDRWKIKNLRKGEELEETEETEETDCYPDLTPTGVRSPPEGGVALHFVPGEGKKSLSTSSNLST